MDYSAASKLGEYIVEAAKKLGEAIVQASLNYRSAHVCPICDGKGSVRNPLGNFVPCAVCDGRGK